MGEPLLSGGLEAALGDASVFLRLLGGSLLGSRSRLPYKQGLRRLEHVLHGASPSHCRIFN